MSITIYFNFITNRDEIMNMYNIIMEEYIITIEQLEIFHRNILDKSSEETRVTFLLDDCPIKIIRIIPFDYTSNDGAIKEKLYMLQFVYNDEINTAMIHQLILTHDGYGFSRKGPKHRLDILIR